MSGAKNLRASIAKLTTSEIPGFAYAGCHSFTVTAVHAGGRCDLAPVKANRFQPLKNVDQWPCIGGAATTPVVGSIAVVEFRDWDDAQPMITRFQPRRIDGGLPTEETLDATTMHIGPTADLVQLATGTFVNPKAVGRVGDSVSLSGVTITAPAGTMGGACTITGTATIITGSGKVFSG